jgi:glycosyltransferase involved in cell wall biosynthesis
MNKKRVIIIRNAKHYDFGGGERFPVFLAEILQQNDIQPLVISRSLKLLSFAESKDVPTLRGWWWSQQNWNGSRAALFPIYFVWQCLLFVWYTQLFLRLKPTAVHIQSKDDFIAATFAAKFCRTRVIWTDHADLKHIWKNIGVWYKNPVGKLVHCAAKHADTITVVSKSELTLVSDNLKKNDTVGRKLMVVYNGVVDTRNDYPTEDVTNTFIFCVASRLVVDKGIGEVITAFTRLVAEYPESRLLLLGDGPDEAQFKKQAAGASSVTFAGYQKDPLRYMASSDVFVHPTYHEGFSVALVEASMLAKPIIATAVGGNVEIIYDDTTGLLVEAKNSDSLYTAMKRCIDDKELCQKLGDNARRQYLERFNFDVIVTKQFIPLYEGAAL